MTDPETTSDPSALVPTSHRGVVLPDVTRLARRTLEARRERAAGPRVILVGPGGHPTIGDALRIAGEGDTILVRPGSYRESIVLDGRSVTISGDGSAGDVIVGSDHGPVFTLLDTRARLTGLTLDRPGSRDEEGSWPAIDVVGGAPVLRRLWLRGATGVRFRGRARGSLSNSRLAGGAGHDHDCTVLVEDGAAPCLEDNEIACGRTLRSGGCALGYAVAAEEVWHRGAAAIGIQGAGTSPVIRANRILRGHGPGLHITDGATPRVEDNIVTEEEPGWTGWRLPGDAEEADGRSLESGWSRDNVEGSLAGIDIQDEGTDPVVRRNRIDRGREGGIVVLWGASPTIEGNTVEGNGEWAAITVDGRSMPRIDGNTIVNEDGDGIDVGFGAEPVLGANDFRVAGQTVVRLFS